MKEITINGSELAAHAVRAGLIDEFQMIVFPVIVGGGKRFFPDGVRQGDRRQAAHRLVQRLLLQRPVRPGGRTDQLGSVGR